MTLKEFISKNNITAYETVNDDIIISVVVGETNYGLNVDTSQVQGGTPVIRFEDFVMNGDILTVNGISINVNDINLIGSDIED